jgi:hypothetical protein
MDELVCFAGGAFAAWKFLHWIVWNDWYKVEVDPGIEYDSYG